MNNIIWFENINQIGGVESVIWNVIRKYKDYDITIIYDRADANQIKRFSKYVRLIKFKDNLFFKCKRLFINYGYEKIKGHYEADKVLYIIHADYVYQNLDCVTDPNFEYYGVSQWACDRYYEKCGIKPKLFPNPIIIDPYTKPLLIVSATRINPDKGQIVWRMEKLANRLDERGIPFLWLIFTNSSQKINNKSCINVGPRLDLIPFLDKADFVAQLSDSEACCMTALESESVGTPMLVTKIPSFYDQGLNEENAIFFDFDMSNIDECIDRMLEKKFDFKFIPKSDKWDKVLAKGKKEKSGVIQVEVIADYYDIELKEDLEYGDIREMPEDRVYYLEARKLVRQIGEL